MKLHSIILGEGNPLLILHGFLGMSDNWKSLGTQFAKAGYQVHLIDLRNHGKSPHSKEFDYPIMAGDIEEYCQDHKLSGMILLGHSMGGKVAMQTAVTRPELVSKLIVVDIAPKYYPPHHQQILQGLQALDEAYLSSRKEAEDLLKEYIEDKGIRLFLLKNLERKEKDRLALKLNLPVLKAKVEHIGAALSEGLRYTGPSLFVRGERSDYITADDELLIQRHFPDSRTLSIPDAGHWVHAENSRDFFQAVREFL